MTPALDQLCGFPFFFPLKQKQTKKKLPPSPKQVLIDISALAYVYMIGEQYDRRQLKMR